MRKAAAYVSFVGFLAFLALRPETATTVDGSVTMMVLLYSGFYNFFQSEQGFCGTYAALGLHWGTEGLQRVKDRVARKKDLSESLRQNIYSVSASAFFLGFVVFLQSL